MEQVICNVNARNERYGSHDDERNMRTLVIFVAEVQDPKQDEQQSETEQ